MGNRFLNDLPDLIDKGIITKEIADKIKDFYSVDEKNTKDKLQVVLAVLGALMVGLGILLILAHNWDSLSKSIKTFFAFIPLIVSQILIIFVLLKKAIDKKWTESVAVFNYIAIAISISLVSQIYHINGEFDDFMLMWMLLALPIVYILNSSMVSLLYIGGITVFVANTSSFGSSQYPKSLLFIPLIGLILPFYFRLLKKQKYINSTYFHNWIIPLSIVISFPIILRDSSEMIPLIMFILFAGIYFTGKTGMLNYKSLFKNAYTIIGVFGTMVMLYIVSFEDYWISVKSTDNSFSYLSISLGFIALVFLFALILMIKTTFVDKFIFNPVEWAYLLFFVLFFLTKNIMLSPVIPVLVLNFFILITGVMFIIKGEKKNDLFLLNIGLLVVSILIIVRFFDYDISFLVRGFIFILIGICFFIANILLIKKRKVSES